MKKSIDVTIIGGGMITRELILPAIYHLQRIGIVGGINICALHGGPLKELKENKEIRTAFRGQHFNPFPSFSEPADKLFPDLYKEVISAMTSYQAVIVAVPDHFHYDVIMHALSCKQHILCVKPLVMKYAQAEEIRRVAHESGLFVGVEYHKRFDRRNLLAKRYYEQKLFGEFMMGEAKMIEPFYYRNSNFQNWFTVDNTDPFVYVGCHYVDLVYFITGLKPVEVTVSGVKRRYPNGKEGYAWANGRVRFDNGAILSIINGLGYPDHAAAANEQGLIMYCEGRDNGGLIDHNDNFRGMSHCYLEGNDDSNARFKYINPDFIRLVPWEGPGLKPVGYGYDSIAATINTIHDIETQVQSLRDRQALLKRRQMIKQVDEKGIIATPANSFVNELVNEAARISILNDGKFVRIIYGKKPRVEPLA